MNKWYKVELTATATMSAAVTIEASSAEEAQRKAVDCAKAGDVFWSYEGVDDISIESTGWTAK